MTWSPRLPFTPFRFTWLTVYLLLFFSCDPNAATDQTLPDVGSVVAPATGQPTKIALGRALFWDPILSGNRDVACATCHHPAFAYTDGSATSVGVGGHGLGPTRAVDVSAPHRTNRNSMTVLNTVFNGISAPGASVNQAQAPMFWDSRTFSLEAQARGPITARDEMLGDDFDAGTIFPELVTRLSSIPEYAAQFQAAFGAGKINESSIAEAIATFERTLVDRDCSFDRAERGEATLSAAATRGHDVFNRSGCNNCHSGPLFSDFKLHRLGVRDPVGATPDVGAGSGRFRTASLRNVGRTAPYMHNGTLHGLTDVFDFYRRVDRQLDPQLSRLRPPDERDFADLAAFLNSLSDGTYDQSVPASVPSGLIPGGNIQEAIK